MNTIAQRARNAALQLEVRKDGLSQRQDGRWALRLIIHPNDFPAALSLAPMGTRYIAALVEVGDDDLPVEAPPKAEKAKRSFDELPASQQAAMLCNEPRFWKFLETYFSADHNFFVVRNAEDAARAVREICSVQSRSDFDEYSAASADWHALHSGYRAWLSL